MNDGTKVVVWIGYRKGDLQLGVFWSIFDRGKNKNRLKSTFQAAVNCYSSFCVARTGFEPVSPP